MRKLCPTAQHDYSTIMKTKQIQFESKGKTFLIHKVIAVLCSNCGDILFPDYPGLSNKELEKMVSASERMFGGLHKALDEPNKKAPRKRK